MQSLTAQHVQEHASIGAANRDEGRNISISEQRGPPRRIPKGIWSLFCLLACAIVSNVAVAKEKLSLALNIDPAFTAMMYGITKGKVSSDLVDLDIHLLDVNALAQAASSKRFDILQVTAQAVPRAVQQGLPMKVIGISVANPDGPGRDIWVKKDSPLRKPEDLKGKTLGIYSLASGAVTLVRIALSKHFGFNVAANGGDFVMKQMRSWRCQRRSPWVSSMHRCCRMCRVSRRKIGRLPFARQHRPDQHRSVRLAGGLDRVHRLYRAASGQAGALPRCAAAADQVQGLRAISPGRGFPRRRGGAQRQSNTCGSGRRSTKPSRCRFRKTMQPIWTSSGCGRRSLGFCPKIVPAASVIWDGAIRD